MNNYIFSAVVCLLSGMAWSGAQEAQQPQPVTQQQIVDQEAHALFVEGVQRYTGIGGGAQDAAAAAAAFLQAAEKGYAPAQYAYAVCCRGGMGVEKNDETAVKYLRAAAEQGYAPAQTTLGVCAERGEGMKADMNEAVRWYLKAVEQDFPRAMCNLAFIYRAGRNVDMERDEAQKEALRLNRRAAEAGNAVAQNGVGWAYMNGLGVGKSYSKAIKWLRMAAEQGQQNALTNLGVCYSRTHVISSNEERKKRGEEIYRVYRLAAEQGFSNAQGLLGECYAAGTGVKANQTLAAMWYRVAADQGNPFAQFDLGSAYEYARGVRYDPVEAVRLYRLSAEQKNPNGMVAYARCCMRNYGGAKEDAETIFRLISEGLELGEDFPRAKMLLGMCYEKGIGVKADPVRARRLYLEAMEEEPFSIGIIREAYRCLYLGIGGEKDLGSLIAQWRRTAAEENDEVAMNELGVCYELGEGVEKNPSLAVEWYRRSATLGNAVARYNLARCYDLGIGVKKDRARAAEWYFKSANKAFKPAIEAYKHMGLKLGPLYKNGRYHSMFAEGSRVPKPDAPAPKMTEPLRAFLCNYEFYAWDELPYKPSMEIKSLDQDKDPTPADEVPPAKTTAQLNEELVRAGDEHWAAGRREEAIQLYNKAAEKWSNEARMRLALCALYGLGMPQDKAEAQRYATAAVNAAGGMSDVVNELLKSAAE